MASHTEHVHHPTPVQRLLRLLRQERHDLAVLFIYTVVAGLLALAVPLAVQALVNTIAAGVFLQPLVVLTFLTFAGLLFSGGVQMLKIALVERIQQRIFARNALDMADRIARVRHITLEGEYAPELANRFFDILTVQKALAKLLIDGLTAVLQAVVGLLLLAFYSPLLLGLDMAIVAMVLFILFVLGIGGLSTSIDESREKYRVAGWLEDLARCHASMKQNGTYPYLTDRADNAVLRYLQAREGHFRIVFRQAGGNYLFQAIASAGVLAAGGWLVINQQLTLGQLVAAQIVIVSLLAAVEKMIRQADQYFDLLTGLDKTGHLTDLETERSGGIPLPESDERGASLLCENVRFSYEPGTPILSGVTLAVRPGEHVSLVGASGAGKTTFAHLLCGLADPTHGTILVNGTDVRDAGLTDLRRVVTSVGFTDEIFGGTVEENIVIGRDFSRSDIQTALEMAQLAQDVSALPDGLKTPLVSGGKNLSRGQVQRLLIARAIVGKPRLLILDEAFTGIDERTVTQILESLFDAGNGWTIMDISPRSRNRAANPNRACSFPRSNRAVRYPAGLGRRHGGRVCHPLPAVVPAASARGDTTGVCRR